MEERKVRIGKRTVDAALPSSKTYRLWDTELKGFGVRITTQGLKTYFVWYRDGQGRRASRREFTVARYGELTPDEARKAAADVLGRVRGGEDPQRNRSGERVEPTVSDLCDTYLRDGVSHKKASTLVSDKVRIERHIKPLLGKLRVSQVTSADIKRFVGDVSAGKTAVPLKPTANDARSKGRRGEPRPETRKRNEPVARGGQGTAARTTGLLGGIFSFAVEEKMRDDNPVHGVSRPKDKQSQRYLSLEELARLGATLSSSDANSLGLTVIRLLVLTGARKGEIESLRWDEVDLQRSCLRLRDSKTGAKVVPLGGAAVEVLRNWSKTKGSPFVFPAQTDPLKPYVGTPRVWGNIKKAAELENVRLHDLRHTYASLAAAAGQSLPLIGKILGHRDVKTTAQYAHLADDPVKRAADQTAKAAGEALAGRMG